MEPDDRAKQLWRRQLVLVVLLLPVAVLVLVLGSSWPKRGGDSADNWLLALRLTGFVLVALLSLTVLHTVQVARFTFRRQED